MTRSTAKKNNTQNCNNKECIFVDEIVDRIDKYRKTKSRLKNNVDIIFDMKEYEFCELGPNLKNGGKIKGEGVNDDNNIEKVDEIEWEKDRGIAQVIYLNKIVKNLIGKDNVIDIKKCNGTSEAILKQLEPFYDDKIIPVNIN
jgi:hypothetical protein